MQRPNYSVKTPCYRTSYVYCKKVLASSPKAPLPSASLLKVKRKNQILKTKRKMSLAFVDLRSINANENAARAGTRFLTVTQLHQVSFQSNDAFRPIHVPRLYVRIRSVSIWRYARRTISRDAWNAWHAWNDWCSALRTLRHATTIHGRSRLQRLLPPHDASFGSSSTSNRSCLRI